MIQCTGADAQSAGAGAGHSPDARGVETAEIVQLDKYEITGSHIPYAADAPAVPIRVIGASDIRNSGIAGDLMDVLRKQMPQFAGAGNIGSNNANVGANRTNGGSMISLRNAPTLVLINGRRAAVSPAAAGKGYTFVDINSIPVASVERIEVLSDGASALYGSDAVSGVVNIILKKDFQGFEAGGSYKFGAGEGQGNWEERSARAIAGVRAGKTSLTVSLEWVRSDPLFQDERPFSENVRGRTSFFPAVAVWTDPADPWHSELYWAVPGRVPPANTNMTPEQLVQAGYYTGPWNAAELKETFNLARYVTLLVGKEKSTVMTAFEHRFGAKLELFGDVLYSKTKTSSQIAANPIVWMPPDASGRDSAGRAEPGHPQNPFNAYVTPRNRFVDYPRQYKTETAAWRLLAGLRGRINEEWHWEGAFNYNYIKQHVDLTGAVDRAAMAAAIDSGILNLFAFEQAPGAVGRSGAVGAAWQEGRSTLATFDVRLNGALEGIMPAGPVRFAAGAEARYEKLRGDCDAGSIMNMEPGQYYLQPKKWDGITASSLFADSRNVAAAFIQVRVPIASPSQNLAGLYTLDVDAAARYECYNDTDDSLVPKVLVRYLPFNNQLAFRFSYAESFNAPTLYQLSTSGETGITPTIHVLKSLGGATVNVEDFANRSRINNPDARPSKSKNYNAGIVYSPKAIQGLVLEANYFYIKRTQVLVEVSEAEMLQHVELHGADSPYARFVTFGGFTDVPVTHAGQVMDSYYQNQGLSGVFLIVQPQNIGEDIQSGVDFSVAYNINTKSAGDFGVRANGMWYRECKYGLRPGGSANTSADYVGTTSGFDLKGTMPRWAANASVTWERGGWSAAVFGNYIPAVTIKAPDVKPGCMGDFTSFDASAGYVFKKGILKGLGVRAGCNNIFDKMPPVAPGVWVDCNADIGTYGCLGRVVYADVSYRF